MSNREFINFREILKQQLHSETFRLDLNSTGGKASVNGRSFEFKSSSLNGVAALTIDFLNCHPNPCYFLRRTPTVWTMQDGDPVDDMSSEELAHHCVALLTSMES